MNTCCAMHHLLKNEAPLTLRSVWWGFSKIKPDSLFAPSGSSRSVWWGFPIRHIRGCHFDPMRKALRINDNMALDPGYLLPPVIPFFFCRVRVLHALSIRDAKTCLLFPPKADTDLANDFFLALDPICSLLPISLHSMSENRNKSFATSESQKESSSTGIRSSADTRARKTLHTDRSLSASSSFEHPPTAALSSQIAPGLCRLDSFFACPSISHLFAPR